MMKKELKQTPYGEPSFVELREQGYAYVDKTPFILALEKCGTRFPFVIRPRRFGKSVFANMLMAYYDKAAAGDFEKNFSGTWIGEHPTPFANKYLVLKFDFSGIDGGEGVVQSFIRKVKSGMQDFVNRYLPKNSRIQAILDAAYMNPSDLLIDFFKEVSIYFKEKIYLIIDEYDQFTQEILSKDPEQFRFITGNDGFLKNFYANIKDSTQKHIKRTFITGVTSISLDSMTSGFTVAKNRTTYAGFAAITGFTEDELRNLIPQIVDLERYGHSVDDIFERMRVLYDGYRFSPNSDVTVFNSSMCLYYLGEIAENNREPAVLLDPSFSIDLSKIDGILSLGDKKFIERIVLDVLFDRPIECHSTSRAINLNASNSFTKQDVLTALVFMGFLTFSSSDPEYLVCPNRAVKDLFFQYWFWKIERFDDFAFPIKNQIKPVEALARGSVQPMLEFIEEVFKDSIGGHAYAHLNETAIQLAVVMAVHTSPIYHVTAEEEALGAGYTDLILRPSKGYADAAAWLMEFKYIKKADSNKKAVDEKISEAVAQLERYSSAKNINSIPNLHRAAVVFSGTELKGYKLF